MVIEAPKHAECVVSSVNIRTDSCTSTMQLVPKVQLTSSCLPDVIDSGNLGCLVYG